MSNLMIYEDKVIVITSKDNAMQAIADVVLNTVSLRSRRDYKRALDGFLTWYKEADLTGFTKATLNTYVAHLKVQGVPASSINQRLGAIRKLAKEAADNGLIEEGHAQAICRVANIEIQGRKLGNWLDQAQAKQMLAAPDVTTIKGLRDQAILAVMLGAGLRREEVVSLQIEHVQMRDARWVILDLKGKHNRTRTVPIAPWIKVLLDNWTGAAGITSGVLFRRILKGGHLRKGGMTSQAVWDIVVAYSPVKPLAPHDLRRTFAKLADKSGAPIVQIQKTLGHASLQTTERYVGADQDLSKAPSDYIDALA